VNIAVSVSGFEMPVATVHIQKFADILEPETELICPNCGKKPSYKGGYDCECGSHFGHWSQLKRVVKGSGEEIVKQRLANDGQVTARAYVMNMEEFAKYVDATACEYGVVVKDENSAKNLRKLLIATKNLDKVILIRYNDTFEERVAVLTTSLSERIILKELIPLNLADIRETMKVNLKEIAPQDLAEAEQFIKMLPPAKEELLNVDDYRTRGVSKEKVSPKVLQLEAVLVKAKAKEKALA